MEEPEQWRGWNRRLKITLLMLAAQKASLNSLFHPNLLWSGSQVTLLQGKLINSEWMNLRSQIWDPFHSPYLTLLCRILYWKGKTQTLLGKGKYWSWLPFSYFSSSVFLALPPTSVSPIPSHFLLLFSVQSSLLSASLLAFLCLLIFFFPFNLPWARFPQ